MLSGTKAVAEECWRWLAAGWLAAGLAGAVEPTSLVRNGDFERGENALEHWMRPDNLTVFWERNGPDGKCVRFDTRVIRRLWEEHNQRPPTPDPGNRSRPVAESVGVTLYSHPIPIDGEGWYLVEYEVKGAGEPFLFLKGYWKCTEVEAAQSGNARMFFRPDPNGPSFSLIAWGGVGEEKRASRPGDYIQSYRRRVVTRFPPGGAGKWHRCRGVVELKRRYHVETVLLELYAYMPAGETWFDNVSLRKITEAEAKVITAGLDKFAVPLPLPAVRE